MTSDKRTPDPKRVAFLRSLPLEVKETIAGEESEAFMFAEDIPESLYEKIKNHITDDTK